MAGTNKNYDLTELDERVGSPSANREIKDGVFKLLFESPENAAELYYALSGIKCSPEEIQIITITTTISGKLKNDLALVARGKVMVIGEHQRNIGRVFKRTWRENREYFIYRV